MTDAELIAQWNAAKNQPVTATTVDPELDKKLVQKWNERENYLKRTGGAMGGAERFGASALNALTTEMPIGVAQMLGTADPKALNRMRAENEVHTATNAGRLGNVVGSSVLPMAVGAGVGGLLGKVPGLANAATIRNAAGGAASGAVLPTMEGESRGKNIAVNAALSAAPSAIKRIFAQPVRPTEAAQKLINEGIYPTPGQASGALNASESAATSIPFFGTAISNARTQPFKEYVARRQKSFGYEGNKLGREATEEMGNVSDEQYRNVIPKLQLEDTPALRAKYLRAQNELDPLEREYREVGKFVEKRFNPLGDKSPARIIGGEDLNNWQSQLRQRAADTAKNGNIDKMDLSNAYNQMREDTLDAIQTQGLVGTGVADEFANARKYYAGMKDLINLGESGAAAKRGGVFTPGEDLNWMKRNYGGESSNMFGRNQVADQNLAQAAVDTLGSMPDTGTAGRLAMLSFLKNPDLGVAEKVIGVAGLPFATQPARKFAVGGYDWQKALGKALKDADNPNQVQPWGTFVTELNNEENR